MKKTMKNNFKQNNKKLSQICRSCRYGIRLHRKGLVECDMKHPGCVESIMEYIVELTKRGRISENSRTDK